MPLDHFGKTLGEERVKRLAHRYGRWLTVSRQDIERASRRFHKHGGVAVLLVASFPQCVFIQFRPALPGMNLVHLIYTSLGTAIWTALLAYLGYVLGSNFTKVC